MAREARALTSDEVRRWLVLVDASEDARRADLPDPVRFLLGTGVRVGEALGATWADVDLDGGTLTIRATIIRVKG